MTWALATIAALLIAYATGVALAGIAERVGRDVFHHRRAAGHRRSPSDPGVHGLVRAPRPRLDGVRGLLLDDTELAHLQTLLLAITATIALSVYAHGLTARPLTERYTRWWNSHPRDTLPAMESVPAADHRLRVPPRAVP